jgi:hypothetical protein
MAKRKPRAETSNERRLVRVIDKLLQYLVTFAVPVTVFVPWVDRVASAYIALGLAFIGSLLVIADHFARPLFRWVLGAASLGVFLFLGTLIRPEPSLTGTVAPPLASRIKSWWAKPQDPIPAIELGQTGVVFNWETKNGAMNLTLPMFDGISSLKFELVDGQTVVTTNVFDDTGALIATVERNQWKVAEQPASWDRNYSDSALEIKDRHGRVIFQLVATGDHVQIQGEWRTDAKHHVVRKDGKPIEGFRIANGAMMTNPRDDQKHERIKPIFKYPGDENLGDLADR